MRLYLAHRLDVENLLIAIWAVPVFKIRNGVALTLSFARPVATNPFDLIAATGRTNRDLQHGRLRGASAAIRRDVVKRASS